MRTAETIEQAKALKESESDRGASRAAKKVRHPNSLKNLVAPWKPGQSGNPGGRVKNDVAAEIARAIFEQNAEKIYEAMSGALLKGNAYVFKEIAERAFGKLKERKEISGPDEGPVQASILVKFVQPDAS